MEELEQVQTTPNLKDGVQNGVVITGISAGSIFRRMGLLNGDIIHTINNQSVSPDDGILSAIHDLEAGSDVSLRIERRGRQSTLNYKLR